MIVSDTVVPVSVVSPIVAAVVEDDSDSDPADIDIYLYCFEDPR